MNLNVVSEKDCKLQYGSDRIADTMFCAAAPMKDSCQVYICIIIYIWVISRQIRPSALQYTPPPIKNHSIRLQSQASPLISALNGRRIGLLMLMHLCPFLLYQSLNKIMVYVMLLGV